jgi:hypothetical protein
LTGIVLISVVIEFLMIQAAMRKQGSYLMDSRIRVVVFPIDTGKEGKIPSDAAAVRECQRQHFSGYPRGEIPDDYFRIVCPEDNPCQFGGRTEQVLFGMGTS